MSTVVEHAIAGETNAGLATIVRFLTRLSAGINATVPPVGDIDYEVDPDEHVRQELWRDIADEFTSAAAIVSTYVEPTWVVAVPKEATT